MADTLITPLQNEYNSDGKENQHGIKTVLDKWEKAINNLDDFGLPGPEFSRQSHAPYYGYPDVWDLSQVTDLTWIDNEEVKGLFEGKNLQKLFIRGQKEFEKYVDKPKINELLGRTKNANLPTNWMELLKYDKTHGNDGPVANVSSWKKHGDDEW